MDLKWQLQSKEILFDAVINRPPTPRVPITRNHCIDWLFNPHQKNGQQNQKSQNAVI
jgi:hypothetical protein